MNWTPTIATSSFPPPKLVSNLNIFSNQFGVLLYTDAIPFDSEKVTSNNGFLYANSSKIIKVNPIKQITIFIIVKG